MIYGTLVDFVTSNHISFYENLSIYPQTEQKKGLSLSCPSICYT